MKGGPRCSPTCSASSPESFQSEHETRAVAGSRPQSNQVEVGGSISDGVVPADCPPEQDVARPQRSPLRSTRGAPRAAADETRSWHQSFISRCCGGGPSGFAGKTSYVPEEVERDKQPNETLRQRAPTFLGFR